MGTNCWPNCMSGKVTGNLRIRNSKWRCEHWLRMASSTAWPRAMLRMPNYLTHVATSPKRVDSGDKRLSLPYAVLVHPVRRHVPFVGDPRRYPLRREARRRLMDLSAWSNVCDPGQHDRDFANAADYTDLVIRVVLNT